MDNLITKHSLAVPKVLFGALIVGLGFFSATNFIRPLITPLASYCMMITGVISFVVVYGRRSLFSLFSSQS